MYILSDKDISTYKIQLNEYFNGEDTWILVKELDANQHHILSAEIAIARTNGKVDVKKLADIFDKFLPEIIVDHNFYKDEKHKIELKEIAGLLLRKGRCSEYITGSYLNDFFIKSANLETKEQS